MAPYEAGAGQLRMALLGTLLAVLMVWEYAPVFRGGFVYEDSLSVDACAGHWAQKTRPLTAAAWCWQVGTQQPAWAFHLLNLVLHLVVTWLVGWLAWSVTGTLVTALLAAAIFGVNAVGVEAVAYLSGRSELLAAIGVLGACVSVLRQRWWLVPPLLLLGWWGKETAGVAAMLVPLCLWYGRGRRWAGAAVLGGALLGLGILWRTATWLEGAHLGRWALVQTSAIVRLLALAVLPLRQTVDYDYARVPVLLQLYAVAMLLAGIALVWRTRSRLLLFGASWTLLAAAPRLIVFTPWSVFSEHQFYLPLVGVSILVAGLMTQETRDHYCPAL